LVRPTLKKIEERLSGHIAKGYVADIIHHHRIQASPGFRRAAAYCRDRFRECGLEGELLAFPAREGMTCWATPVFQEWEATEGLLHLVEPQDAARKLADYGELRMSLIQRSASFDGEAEVVLLEDGEEWDEYEGLDLMGKVVLTRGDKDRLHYLAVEKHGAAGIIFDGMKELPGLRHTMDLPDALQYTSFWWYGGERKCFGFVLSPKEGSSLRSLIKQREREGKPPVKVRAKVTSRFWDGELNVVSAVIRGQTDEEVVVVAHLCHPQWSANDNASGAATVLEVARTLQGLISEGRLDKPHRGIRFLLVPEISGTQAYLASNEDQIPRMIAGLNLDMVGENQDLCGSSLLVERLPGPAASFADDLVESLLEGMIGETGSFSGLGSYASFRHAVTPFSGGSDHYILSDPSVGIPCPMIIQWPDKFYHTSTDTLDKVDPAMLARVGTIAATYACFLANAGDKEVAWLGQEMVSRFKTRVLAVIREGVKSAMAGEDSPRDRELLARRVRFLAERHHAALNSLRHLAEVDVSTWQKEAFAFAEAELARVEELIPHARRKPPQGTAEEEAGEMVPRRLHRGPLELKDYLNRMNEGDWEAWWRIYKERPEATWVYPPLLLYWADGERNVQGISDLIELETGKRVTEMLVTYCRIWEHLGLLELQGASL
jgi:aminopeptidase YwaD